MARPGDRGDQPELGPNQPYPPNAGQAQFPPTQYAYHSTSEYPSLDQDLNMSDTYGQPIQQNIAGQLQAASTNAPQNGDVNAMSVNTNGATSAGMAPPQAPHQAEFAPPDGHASVDDTPDPADATINKRKRSKVSRACDECRRKKVKCDAAELDGELKTCTNCSKAGLTCEYVRVPMKRGPSKGYIKELSDRVQQVESLQAVLAGQPGYRSSLDGQSMAEAMYSPDDPMSLKRNFSFSDARNPFAASEFQRDRIPSVGGAWTNSPTSAGFRPRDRGSLALAPDQPLPTSYPKSSPPYWTSSSTQPPPTKRQKRGSDHVPSIMMLSKHVDKYYEAIHPEFPLLPDLDTTLTITGATSPAFSLLFATSVALIPATENEKNEDSDDVEKAISQKFPNCSVLWDTVSKYMKEHPKKRSAEDNLVLTWSCVLLAIHCDYKVKGVLGGSFTQTSLIKEAMDLIMFLLKDENDAKEGRTPTSIEGDTFHDLVEQARNLTLMMAKFHALGTAGIYYVNHEVFSIDVDFIHRSVPGHVALHAMFANLVSLAIIEIQTMLQANNLQNIEARGMILNLLQASTTNLPGVNEDTPTYRQAVLFFDLVLSRYHHLPVAAHVLGPASTLAEELSQATDPAGTGPSVWKPLDVHIFTLVTITLLEVLTGVPHAAMQASAEHALNTIQPLLERKVEAYHSYKSKLEKDEKWYEGEEEGVGREDLSWMEVLVKHIGERRKVGWIQPVSVDANSVGALVGAGNNMSVAFDMLLRTGYLKVLSGLT